MTEYEALIQTIREATGQSRWLTAASVAEAANALNISSFCTIHAAGECLSCGSERAYYDEDADEIRDEVLA